MDVVNKKVSIEEVDKLLNSASSIVKENKNLIENNKQEEPAKKPNNEKSYTYEEICELELKEAHEKNKENPDFDYRNLYSKGDKIYYVLVIDDYVKRKELISLTVRTVYPRMIVGVQEGYQCQCIGYKQKDNIFINKVDADAYFESLDEYVDNEEIAGS